MPRFEAPLPSIETKIVRPVRGSNGRFAYEGAVTDPLFTDDSPHYKATVDARASMQFAPVVTYWYDPDGVGRSIDTLFYLVNPAPTKTTPGTRYDQVLYYRFTVGTGASQRIYQYKKRLTYLKNAPNSTPDQPWVPSSDEDDPVFLVDNLNNRLVDKRGAFFTMEPII